MLVGLGGVAREVVEREGTIIVAKATAAETLQVLISKGCAFWVLEVSREVYSKLWSRPREGR